MERDCDLTSWDGIRSCANKLRIEIERRRMVARRRPENLDQLEMKARWLLSDGVAAFIGRRPRLRNAKVYPSTLRLARNGDESLRLVHTNSTETNMDKEHVKGSR
jgi:hypothetical protein